MSDRWHYSLDGRNKAGPVSVAELRRLARAGKLLPTHMLLPEAGGRWQPASSLPALFPPSSPAGRSSWAPVLTCLAAPVVACKELGRRVGLARLRRRLRRQRTGEQQLLLQVGGGLFASGAAVAGGEPLAAQLRLLHQQRLTAQQGGPSRKKEAGRLGQLIDDLSTELGRVALKSSAPFAGRPAVQPRWDQSRQDLARTEAEIGKREQAWAGAPRRVKGQALGGLVFLAALLILPAVLFWPRGESKPGGEQIADAGTTPEKKTGPEPKGTIPEAKKPSPLSLRELFAKLSPAVPLVRAIDNGSGSGFLVKHESRYLVLTNRHVVENARKGLEVEFLKENGEKHLTIPAASTTVTAIHKTGDLAVIDVSKAAADIEKKGLQAVPLAPAHHKPKVGEHVFAIGHPGRPDKGVLSSTLSDGIVSAIDRELEGAKYVQITVPINPGNSGGPLFDDEGRVVGVNTFTFRESRETTLEALNFALDGSFIHELLTDPAKSLDQKEIVAVVSPTGRAGARSALRDRLEALERDGYRPYVGDIEESIRITRVLPRGQSFVPLDCRPGETYFILGAVRPSKDAKLRTAELIVMDSMRNELGRSKEPSPAPELEFRTRGFGPHPIVVLNGSTEPLEVILILFRKGPGGGRGPE